VNDRDVAALLDAGGMATADGTPAKYNALADPAGAEDLARRLAEQARNLNPTVVAVWEDPEDAILGHVVARELGVRAVRAWNADGLVGQSGPLQSGDRVLLVLDAVRDPRSVLAVHGVVARDGATLVGTAVLTATDALDQARADLGDPGRLISLTDARSTTEEHGGTH
jgi:adenine/guanine phosphoribosyltransferase-like PRPP-binding protein